MNKEDKSKNVKQPIPNGIHVYLISIQIQKNGFTVILSKLYQINCSELIITIQKKQDSIIKEIKYFFKDQVLLF
jgi:hypothetical protein